MELSSQSHIKGIFRVTGTPENFLTALRFKVWGFNNKDDWDRQEPGDLIFFHSQRKSAFKKNPESRIVGFGVVGNNFFIDSNPLWIDEKIEGKSYPYKFSFSEMYFFADIPVNDDWDSTTEEKRDVTLSIINQLLENGMPTSELNGFPVHGGYSKVNDKTTIQQLLKTNRDLSLYFGEAEEDMVKKSTEFSEFTNENESLRYATTLTVFDDIKKKVIRAKSTAWKTNFDLLANAEKSHFDIVSYLRLRFIGMGYKVFFNNHVDLFAHNSTNSVLVEAKSIENKNFITQSRKGIAQLYEYSYFEVSKFKAEKNLKSKNDFKLLATSKEPADSEYIKFINSMDIHATVVQDGQMKPYGQLNILRNL